MTRLYRRCVIARVCICAFVCVCTLSLPHVFIVLCELSCLALPCVCVCGPVYSRVYACLYICVFVCLHVCDRFQRISMLFSSTLFFVVVVILEVEIKAA